MKTTTVIVFALIIISGANAFSQDTLLFLTGKTVEGNITSTNNIGITITSKGLLTQTTRNYYKDEIYSMSIEGKRTILYTRDSANGNVFNTEQMYYFIKGIQEGKEHYHAPLATLGGLASGITGGVFGFWGMTIPATYVFVSGIKTPKINEPLHISENLLSENEPVLPEYGLKYNASSEIEQREEELYAPYYDYGYKSAAKDKKIKNAIKGSVIGFVAFVAASYIMINR